jgi:receptor protein-tyrosine kinase
MNAEPTASTTDITDQDVSDALVLLHGLSEESVGSIHELARSLHLRFADAALHAGQITQDQLEEAVDWIRRRALKQKVSIVEEVLRRRGNQRRDLVLWEGPKLKPSDQLIVAHNLRHPHSESIRGLCSELLMRTRNQGGAIISLLSPCAGEGRSQLAAEIAIAFAQLGRRTLLVDADMRLPRQHVLFNVENNSGLADALVDTTTKMHLHGIEDLPQMALLTSGASSSNPLELLSGIRFEQLAIEWRRSFEYVIVDTPPAAESSDAIAVASVAANVLLLSRANVTPFSALKELARKLETTHARTLGAVIGKF